MSVAGHGCVEDAEGDAVETLHCEGVPGVGEGRVQQQPQREGSQHQRHRGAVTKLPAKSKTVLYSDSDSSTY